MNERTTVSIAALGTAVATICITVVALAGVNLGNDETAVALTGALATVFTVIFGYALPR